MPLVLKKGTEPGRHCEYSLEFSSVNTDTDKPSSSPKVNSNKQYNSVKMNSNVRLIYAAQKWLRKPSDLNVFM